MLENEVGELEGKYREFFAVCEACALKTAFPA